AAELTVALREVLERAEQFLTAEVRPQRVEEEQLGIGRLPEQEVGEPVLAASADKEIGLGQATRKEARGEELGRDRLGIETAFLAGAGKLAGSGRVLFLAAIIEGEGEIETRVVDGAALGVLDHPVDIAGDALAAADDADADIAVMELIEVAAEISAEET